MRIMRRLAILTISLLTCAGVGSAQGPAPASAAQSPQQGVATVYVYRRDEGMVMFGFLRKTRPVYFREHGEGGPKRKNREIAGLKNKRYFMLRLPPGKYVFDTRLMQGRLELEVAAGGEYYLRLDQGDDCPSENPDIFDPPKCKSRSASIESVSRGRWRGDMSVLKPVESGNVKDRKLVIIPPGTPSDNVAHPTAR